MRCRKEPFDYQSGRLWRAVWLAGDQPAERGHSRAWHDREASRGDQRLDRDPFDVLCDAELRPPGGRWGGGAPVSAQGERDIGELVGAGSLERLFKNRPGTIWGSRDLALSGRAWRLAAAVVLDSDTCPDVGRAFP